jgi:hypothetical protein
METTISVNIAGKPLARPAIEYSSLHLLGYWSSIASLLFALGYSAAQLLSWLKVTSYPGYLVLLFLPSLFLAPSFRVAIICLHHKVQEELKIWSAIGVAFALIYRAFATLTYFTQLGSVVPGILRGEIAENHVLFFKPGSFTI